MKAARLVLEENGYLETRITDIAAAADIAVGSFYTYFESKEALFLEIVKDFYDEMIPVSLGEPGVDPVGHLNQSNRHYIEYYRDNRGILALIESVSTFIPEVREMRLQKRRVNVAMNIEAIERLQAHGRTPLSLNPFVTASALQAMVSNFTYFWLVLGEMFDEDVAVDQLTLIWARVLGLDEDAADEAAQASPQPGRRRTRSTSPS